MVNIGEPCQITAHVNEPDLSKVKFTWLKYNNYIGQDEAILGEFF